MLTVGERGWDFLQNGEFLEAADEEFDVLLTIWTAAAAALRL